MDPDREALRKAIEKVDCERNSNPFFPMHDHWATIYMSAKRDLARLEGENMGTDRHGLADDKLGRAVSKLTSHIIGELQHHGSVNYTYPEFQEALRAVRDAARDEMTTKEAEKPKRASLGELVEALKNSAISARQDSRGYDEILYEEAAAVLRAVGGFRVGMDDAESDQARIFAAVSLRRSLP